METEYSANPTPQPVFDASMPTAAAGLVRFFNNVLDCIFLAFVATTFIYLFAPEMMPKSIADVTSGLFMSLLYPLQFVYYLVSEFFFGRTLGKVITRTYVTTEFNEKPGFGAILIRTLCRYIPCEYLSFLWSPIGWHDKFSKTYVVRKPSQF